DTSTCSTSPAEALHAPHTRTPRALARVASPLARHGPGGPSSLQNWQGRAAPGLEGSIPSPRRTVAVADEPAIGRADVRSAPWRAGPDRALVSERERTGTCAIQGRRGRARDARAGGSKSRATITAAGGS